VANQISELYNEGGKFSVAPPTHYLRYTETQIDITAIRSNRLHKPAPTLAHLKEVVVERWYMVHAGQDDNELSFTLCVYGREVNHQIIDKYVENAERHCQVESIVNLEWITQVVSIRRVQLMPHSWEFMPNKPVRL
jgi:hypothetical protein